MQILIPFRSLIYPGELFWTEEGYRFSWRVMLMEKAGYASFKIVDLIKAISPQNKNEIIGIRPGEKIHEELVSVYEGYNTVELKDCYLILPTNNPSEINKYCKKYKAKKVKNGFSYTSQNNSHFLSVTDLRKIIQKKFISSE